MTKKKFTVEEQLAVKKSIIDEFKLTEKRVSHAWLDVIDCDPDPKNPDHWDFLLYSPSKEVYVNLRSFPRITIEPTHTDSYKLGILNYEKNMPVETVLWYLHNILDRR